MRPWAVVFLNQTLAPQTPRESLCYPESAFLEHAEFRQHSHGRVGRFSRAQKGALDFKR